MAALGRRVPAPGHGRPEHRVVERCVEIAGDDRRLGPGTPLGHQAHVGPPLRHVPAAWGERVERDEPQLPEATALQLDARERGRDVGAAAHVAETVGDDRRDAAEVAIGLPDRGDQVVAQRLDQRGQLRAERRARLDE
jgi:hypothetical protein